MTVYVVRLGSPRGKNEGLRIGTVRRPPRGVKREHYASGNWYDVWLPVLSPSAETVRMALDAETSADLSRFTKRYRREMKAPDAARTLLLLAALSQQTNFAVGCYCADHTRCHRTILGELLAEQGALMAAEQVAAKPL